jgi:outer membrane protein OmpU
MRKYLLSTSAIAGVALLSTAALADVSISGSTEFEYMDSDASTASEDGTKMGTAHEVYINFSNKTDSGLTIDYKTQFNAGTGAVDDNALYISGGFGQIILGNTDGAEDLFAVGPDGLIAEESDGVLAASATILVDAGSQLTSNAPTKVTYLLPAMGGLTAGVSLGDSALADNSETAEFGLNFTTEAAGGSVTLGYSSATQEAASQDIDNSVIGATMTSGALSVSAAQVSYEASGEDITGNSVGFSYALPSGLKIGALTYKSEDDIDTGEEYTANQYEAIYPIASGLSAVVTVTDFDYKKGSTSNNGAADDRDGTITTLNIKASF